MYWTMGKCLWNQFGLCRFPWEKIKKKSFPSIDGLWFNRGLPYDFSTLPCHKSNTHWAVTALWMLDFTPPRVNCEWYDVLPCSGQGQGAIAPAQGLSQKDKQPIHLQSFCTPTTIWFLTLSKVNKRTWYSQHFFIK